MWTPRAAQSLAGQALNIVVCVTAFMLTTRYTLHLIRQDIESGSVFCSFTRAIAAGCFYPSVMVSRPWNCGARDANTSTASFFGRENKAVLSASFIRCRFARHLLMDRWIRLAALVELIHDGQEIPFPALASLLGVTLTEAATGWANEKAAVRCC